jgi:hypothetical protein
VPFKKAFLQHNSTFFIVVNLKETTDDQSEKYVGSGARKTHKDTSTTFFTVGDALLNTQIDN